MEDGRLFTYSINSVQPCRVKCVKGESVILTALRSVRSCELRGFQVPWCKLHCVYTIKASIVSSVHLGCILGCKIGFLPVAVNNYMVRMKSPICTFITVSPFKISNQSISIQTTLE